MYVEIRNGKANPIVVEPDKVDKLRNHGLVIIDITNIEPKPQPGWLYDAETKTFSEPPKSPDPEPGPIELITKKLEKLITVLKTKQVIAGTDINDIEKK